MSATTVPGLLRDLLSGDPARPLVTFYDDATGERVELSVTSFENWVAKTANLLQGELAAEPGDRVSVRLPVHWQSAVWMCAAAACGVVVSTDPGGADPAAAETSSAEPPAVAVCGPDAVDAATGSGAGEVVALSLLPMGQGFAAELPPGATDYARTVLAQPDAFAPLVPPDPDSVFLDRADGPRTQRELLADARERAGSLGLHPAGRLLTDANPADPHGLTGGLLAAMVTGGSVVLTRHPDPNAVDGRVAQEQVTAQWWAGR